jgi:hypothetical protein
MRKIVRYLLPKVLLVLVLAEVAYAADEYDSMFTCGMLNGRGWATLSGLSKDFYLRGAWDGMTVVSTPPNRDFRFNHFPEHFTLAEMKVGLDNLYKDPANALLAVIDGALLVINVQFSGKSAREVNDTLTRERRLALACAKSDVK